MRVQPISFDKACAFIARHHRHNKPPQGHRFSISLIARDLFDVDAVMGVVVVGRPVARKLDDGLTAEVTRLCVAEDVPKGACSMLYRAAWRAWREMGGKRMVTYTLQAESGASLRGAGFKHDALLRNTPADQWTNRPGRVTQQVVGEPKQRWSLSIE